MLRKDTVDLEGGRSQVVYHAGEGPIVVWLHGLNGVEADEAFIARLANRNHVVAPLAPGFTDLDELLDLRDIHDLALHYDDIFDTLEIDRATVLGHSFGAMIAAEIAAHVPHRVSNLVLISPLGLWNDDYPVTDIFAVPSPEMPTLLYANVPVTANGSAQQPDVEKLVTLVQGMTTVARFLWPIPDRGLNRRLRRIKAKTLIVHGAQDAFVPVRYAHDFKNAISNASVSIIEQGSHMLPTEFPDPVLSAIEEDLPR